MQPVRLLVVAASGAVAASADARGGACAVMLHGQGAGLSGIFGTMGWCLDPHHPSVPSSAELGRASSPALLLACCSGFLSRRSCNLA